MNHFVYFPFLAVQDRDSKLSKRMFERRYTEGKLAHTHVVWKDGKPLLDGRPGALKELMRVGNTDKDVLIIDCHGDGHGVRADRRTREGAFTIQ
jgi:hypothetical protein